MLEYVTKDNPTQEKSVTKGLPSLGMSLDTTMLWREITYFWNSRMVSKDTIDLLSRSLDSFFQGRHFLAGRAALGFKDNPTS